MIQSYKLLCNLYPFYKYHVISLIGGGGKTSMLFRLGDELKQHYAHVCLSTTTHMMYPMQIATENIFLHDDTEVLKAMLHHHDMIYAAALYQDKKLTKPCDAVLSTIEQEAGIVLYEADGSKHLPIKCMGEHEPALRDSTQLCVQMIGYSCMDKPLSQVLHRYELACSSWGWNDTEKMDVNKLIQLATYNFTKVKTDTKLLVINQIDEHLSLEDVSLIRQHFTDIPVLFISLKEQTMWHDETVLSS